MKKTIWLRIKPFSINAYHSANKRFKTSAARDWEMSVFYQMAKPYVQDTFRQLRDAMAERESVVELGLTAYYPQFFTVSGIISNRTLDITNWEKPLVDLLMLPKYHETPSPHGAPNLNFDDRFLIKVTSEKAPSKNDEYWVKIDITIHPAPKPETHLIEGLVHNNEN